MKNNTFFATYLLYNIIFIERQLESDNFGSQEKEEILNVASFSFLALHHFIDQKYNIVNTQTVIKNSFKKKYITLTLDTLQDMIALDNNIDKYLSVELSMYKKIGKLYYTASKQFFPDLTSLSSKFEDVFSTTMIYYETVLALDSSNYDVPKTLIKLSDHSYKDVLTSILNRI